MKFKIGFVIYIIILIFSILMLPTKVLAQQNDELIPSTLIRLYMDILKNEPNPQKREDSAYLLARIKSVLSIETLIEVMNNDNNINVTIACAYALGEIDHIKSLKALFDVYYNMDADFKLRVQALYSISKLDGENRVPFFINILDNYNVYIRSTASRILSRFKRKEVSKALIKLIKKEENELVLKEVIISLGKQLDFENIPYIELLFNKSDNEEIKILCALSIYRIAHYLNIEIDEKYINILNKNFYFDNHKILSGSALLIWEGDRTMMKYLMERFYDKSISFDEKKYILEAFSESSIEIAFDLLFEVYQSNNYLLKRTVDEILLNANTNILISLLPKRFELQKLILSILFIKLKANPELEFSEYIKFFKIENNNINNYLYRIILKLDKNIIIPILQNNLDSNSNILIGNILYILIMMNDDDAFSIVEENLNNISETDLVNIFKKIDKTANYRLSEVFLKNLLSNNKRLRLQSYNSLINSLGAQIDYLDALFYQSLGRITPEINIVLNNISEYGIKPLYSIFSLDTELWEDSYYYTSRLSEIDKELLQDFVPEGINFLIRNHVKNFINDYKIKVYYSDEMFRKLQNIFLKPVIDNIFKKDKQNVYLKLLFIPILSKIDYDIDKRYDYRKYILYQMESFNQDIILITSENLIYIFRTLYRPLDDEKLVLFRNVLSKRILLVTEYLNYYSTLKEKPEDEKTENEKKFTEIYLKRIIKGLDRALMESIIVDKDLYLQLLNSDISSESKILLISKLKIITDYNDVKNLLIKLANDDSPSVRYESIKILEIFITEPSIEKLFIEKLADENDEVRLFAINSLINLDKKIVNKLIELLELDDELLTESIISIISAIGENAVDIIRANVNIKKRKIKLKIITILGNIASNSAVEILKKMISEDDKEINKKIAISLINIGIANNQVKYINIGLELLDDNDVIELLESDTINIEKSFNILINSLKTSDKKIYNRTIKSLIRIGEKNIDLLIYNLSNTNYFIRKGIEEVLFNLDSEYVIQALINALESKNQNVVQSSINILSNYGVSIIEELEKIIRSDNYYLRFSVVKILENIQNEKIIYLLVLLLKDKDWRIKSVVIRILKTFGFQSNEIEILSRLSLEEIISLKDMSLEEIYKSYINSFC